MGIFSGGFFGGGTDETEISTTNRISTTTETETNIRDIGLTGNAAVALVDSIEEGSILRSNADTLRLRDLTTAFKNMTQDSVVLFSQGFNAVSNGLGGLSKGTQDLIKNSYVYTDKNLERQSDLQLQSTQEAYNLIESQTKQILNANITAGGEILNKAISTGEKILSDSSDIKTGGFSSSIKIFSYIIAGFFVVILFLFFVRK